MAIEWTRAEFDLQIPELSGVSVNAYNAAAAAADLQLNRAAFGSKIKLAGCYMTAHILARNPPAGATPQGAPVASESISGGPSVSYAVRAAAPGETVYLVELRRLSRPGVIGGLVP
jgi:hypothetical protein